MSDTGWSGGGVHTGNCNSHSSSGPSPPQPRGALSPPTVNPSNFKLRKNPEILKKKSNTDLKLGDFHSKLQQSSLPNPPWPAVYTELFTRAAVLTVSVSKPVSGFYREVSLVLSISSGEDKKTDGTGQVRGPCCGWQVCLFGLSQISCSSPPPTLLRLCLQPDLEVTTQRRIKATFQHRVNTIHPTHHSDRLKTHGASVGLLPCSDKNNNGLIYTCGAAWAEV